MKWLLKHGYLGTRASGPPQIHTTSSCDPNKYVVITFDDAYRDIADFAIPCLVDAGFTATVFVPTDFIGGKTPWDGRPVLNRLQIRAFAEAGIEIGSHGRSHANLQGLTSEKFSDEINVSADILEQLIGKPVSAFAYPNGLYNDEALSLVRNRYRLAFTTKEGINRYPYDAHRLQRLMMNPQDGGADMGLRIRFGFGPARALRQIRAKVIHTIRSAANSG